YLKTLETEERIKALPHLQERAPNVEIGDVPPKVVDDNNDGKRDNDNTASTDDETRVSISHQDLKEFRLSLLIPSTRPLLSSDEDFFLKLQHLDVSNNELSVLPGLGKLSNLQSLNLSRNWFNKIPEEIMSLTKLTSIDASRNFFRPNEASLKFETLRKLPLLATLNLSYNQKCGRPHHIDLIRKEVPQLQDLKITVWEKICSNEGAYVGASAAERNPTLLRSQLEPWGTVRLRRRLVQDFGLPPSDSITVDRSMVMQSLLECYLGEGLLEIPSNENMSESTDLNLGIGRRRVVHLQGSPVCETLLNNLLKELRSWRGDKHRGGSSSHRERPSIKAKCYMIMRAPDANDRKLEGQVPPPDTAKLSRRAQRTAKKMERNGKLWELAIEAMRDVDPAFASRCTEIAVTYGFTGSPHIDKQNCGPFYGLAMGEFTEGTGQVCVECSARVLCKVNTKNRLGRIDGRSPHWVAPYNVEEEERFSLIYYETGGKFTVPGPAVFSVPSETQPGCS
ncbi:MAG: hypothetical protein SGILL_001268, partial [Bacillariaceae sp.]